MSDALITFAPAVADAVRASMTEEERRDAANDRQNAFLALDLDDADVLFVLTERAHAARFADIDAYIAGVAAGYVIASSPAEAVTGTA